MYKIKTRFIYIIKNMVLISSINVILLKYKVKMFYFNK